MGTPKTSIAAVFSLVFGILGCIPLVTSVLAVLLGIVGINATKNNQRSGRGLAIAGLLLGLLGVVLWGLFGGGLFTLWKVTGPVRAEGKQFIQYLADGNTEAAHAQCTSDISKEQVEALVTYVKPLGALKDVTSFSAQASDQNGAVTAQMGGAATFTNDTKPFAMSFEKVNGQWKVSGIQFDPNGGGKTTSKLPKIPTMPATAP